MTLFYISLFDFNQVQKITLTEINKALEKLEYLVPLLKKQFLTACAECLQSSQSTTIIGWDFLRVIAAGLGCPMPIINRPAVNSTTD